MEKKLNLLGVRKLKLIEAEQPQQNINIEWLREQLQANNFQLEQKNDNLYIGYTEPILQLFFTYANDKNNVFNDVRIDNTDKFPLIKKQEVKLVGVELTTQNLKNAINKMIPTSQTMVEDVENLPTQSIQNIQQWESVKSYMEDTLHFTFQETDVKDDSGVVYNLIWRNAIATIYPKTIKWGFGRKQTKYNSLEEVFKAVAKNLGIKDLTSQLFTNKQIGNAEEVEDEENNKVEQNAFNRNALLNNEYIKLKSQLSDAVKQILNSINEDYDNKNINIWDLAYSKCKTSEEKDILIKAFLNKKMNISSKQVENNFLGLRKWVDSAGFDINKNLALKFIDNYSKKYKDQEIPSGSILLLIELANDNIISTKDGQPNILSDTNSILYYPNTYATLGKNYSDVVDIITMYRYIYNMDPRQINKDIKEQLINQFTFLSESDFSSTYNLANKVCLDNGKLRDKVTIETIYTILSGKNYARKLRDYTDEVDIEDILDDINYDNKIDNLPKANQRTLKLVQDITNKILRDNPKIINDFKQGLQQGKVQ